MKKGKDYEILIEQLYKKVDPQSVIKRNDKLYGYESKTEREIDLSIKHKVGLHELLMIVQAKDYGRPVGVGVIGELATVVRDVRANKGIVISPKGFTKAALTLAASLGIDALTGHDLSNPKWAIDLKMPVILYRYTGAYTVRFNLVANQAYADLANNKSVPPTPPVYLFKITEDAGKTFHTIHQKFHFLCTYGHLVYDDCEHTIQFSGEDLRLFITNEVLTPLTEFQMRFKLKRETYYKYFDVREFQGFIDRNTNNIARANVKIESDEFILSNYDITNKKNIDLSTWNAYDDNVDLIHAYKIKCSLLDVAGPGASNFEFAGNVGEPIPGL